MASWPSTANFYYRRSSYISLYGRKVSRSLCVVASDASRSLFSLYMAPKSSMRVYMRSLSCRMLLWFLFSSKSLSLSCSFNFSISLSRNSILARYDFTSSLDICIKVGSSSHSPSDPLGLLILFIMSFSAFILISLSSIASFNYIRSFSHAPCNSLIWSRSPTFMFLSVSGSGNDASSAARSALVDFKLSFAFSTLSTCFFNSLFYDSSY